MLEIERPRIVSKELTENYGMFVVEPLERGFGHTLGNALRRVLLNSLPRAAVTSIRIDGVQHEFSTVPGVKEDVSEIILNFKELSLRMYADQPKTLELNAVGPCEVTAADIQADDEVEVINPDLHIATLGENGKLVMELTFDKGLFVKVQDHSQEAQELRIEYEEPLTSKKKMQIKWGNLTHKSEEYGFDDETIAQYMDLSYDTKYLFEHL